MTCCCSDCTSSRMRRSSSTCRAIASRASRRLSTMSMKRVAQMLELARRHRLGGRRAQIAGADPIGGPLEAARAPAASAGRTTASSDEHQQRRQRRREQRPWREISVDAQPGDATSARPTTTVHGLPRDASPSPRASSSHEVRSRPARSAMTLPAVDRSIWMPTPASEQVQRAQERRELRVVGRIRLDRCARRSRDASMLASRATCVDLGAVRQVRRPTSCIADQRQQQHERREDELLAKGTRHGVSRTLIVGCAQPGLVTSRQRIGHAGLREAARAQAAAVAAPQGRPSAPGS